MAAIYPFKFCILGCLFLGAYGQHFKAGSIYWTSQKLTDATYNVNFVFTGTFNRSFQGFVGSAADGRPALGDIVELRGYEPAFLYSGDGNSFPISLTVTSIDVEEDWLQGVWTQTVNYRTPINSGAPWIAMVRGCCRSLELIYSAYTPYQLVVSLNLSGTNSSSSGRISSVPVLRVFPGSNATSLAFAYGAAQLPPFNCSSPAAAACAAAAAAAAALLDPPPACAADALPPLVPNASDCRPALLRARVGVGAQARPSSPWTTLCTTLCATAGH